MITLRNLLLLVSLSGLTAGHAQVFDWTTIAGSVGIAGTNDDVGTNALFANPQGLAVDTAGNIFVADADNSLIREISVVGSSWQVTTIAGSAGVTGADDGTGDLALFANPQGITVDTADNVFVADTGNSTIRKMSLVGGSWTVTTIAGQSGVNLSRDGTNAAAGFKYPCGLAADAAGNLYVADTQGFTIRKITPSGTNWIVTTMAGKAGSHGSKDGSNSVARFQAPFGIAVDTNGVAYVADGGNNNIRKLVPDGTNWVVTTIAGNASSGGAFIDGTNTDALFNFPQGITVDAAGNLFVADTGNNTIRQITPQGTNWVTVTIAAGSDDPDDFLPALAGSDDGVGGAAQFYQPAGICVTTNGLIYVSDSSNYTIRLGCLPPVIQSVTYDGTEVAVAWSTINGLSYQLQYTTTFNPAAWISLGLPQLATNAVLMATDTPGGDAQRFYRVAMVP